MQTVHLDQGRVAAALSACLSVADKKATVPVTGYILVKCNGNGVSFTANDLEQAATVAVANGEDFDPWAIGVPAHLFGNIARQFAKDSGVSITHDEAKKRVRVKCGGISASLPGIAGEEFPVFGEPEGPAAAVMPAADLSYLFTRTIGTASGRTKMDIGGALLEITGDDAACTATDGARLALARVAGDFALEVKGIVPRRFMGSSMHILSGVPADEEMKVYISKSAIYVRSKNVQLSSRLIANQFPNYRAVLTQLAPRDTKFTVETQAFQRALAASQAFAAREATHPIVALTIHRDKILLSASNQNSGEYSAEIEAESTVEGMRVAVNPDFLLDFCSTAGDGKTVAECGPTGHGRLDLVPEKEVEGRSFKYLVSPCYE